MPTRSYVRLNVMRRIYTNISCALAKLLSLNRPLNLIAPICLVIFLTFSACGSAEYPIETVSSSETIDPYEAEEPYEPVIEIIRDLGGREMRIASGWSYLPQEHISRIEQEFNIRISEQVLGHDELMHSLQTSVMAGDPFADMVLLSGDMVFLSITGNLIYALQEFISIPSLQPRLNNNPSPEPRPNNSFLDFYWSFEAFPITINPDRVYLGVNLDIINGLQEINGNISSTDENIFSTTINNFPTEYWTFEKFWEIMSMAVDIGYYGISGVPGDIIAHLIAANDGVMVSDFIYAYDDPHTVRALEFASRIFSMWQPDHGIHNRHGNFFAFTEEQSAFFPISEWAIPYIDFNHKIIPFPKGPDNESGYSYMKGFDTGMAIPRRTRNPADVSTVFERIFSYVSQETPVLSASLISVKGKFDLGMAVPTFDWMNWVLAENFADGTTDNERSYILRTLERFRSPQQAILDNALTGWVTRTHPTQSEPQ